MVVESKMVMNTMGFESVRKHQLNESKQVCANYDKIMAWWMKCCIISLQDVILEKLG